ncbi:hypothetical protein L195_g061532 [Trifolium pratense]|uniref:Uncharacterized protein n=1 Tax=Trifolium pratense TaxID=57577 RepID=A0A2K3KAD3_TRIPR|nr:hypothetical protein L195_g061532 [Trifolium pratense]
MEMALRITLFAKSSDSISTDDFGCQIDDACVLPCSLVVGGCLESSMVALYSMFRYHFLVQYSDLARNSH